jgi:hypothetical protein
MSFRYVVLSIAGRQAGGGGERSFAAGWRGYSVLCKAGVCQQISNYSSVVERVKHFPHAKSYLDKWVRRC